MLHTNNNRKVTILLVKLIHFEQQFANILSTIHRDKQTCTKSKKILHF